jgi:serine/threonine protein kinase
MGNANTTPPSTPVDGMSLSQMPSGVQHVLGVPPVGSTGTVIKIRDVEYTLEQKLGAGAYGVVYAASSNNHKFAVKIIRSKDTRSVRAEAAAYMRNGATCASTQHVPCLIDRLDYENGGSVLVTSLAPGVSCAHAFQSPRTDLDTAGFLLFVMMALKPLVWLHSNQIQSGDVKLENLVVLFDDETGIPLKVTAVDFGLSCSASSLDDRAEKDTCQSRFDDPPTYMDPQYREGISNMFQADMYSVGAMLLHLADMQEDYTSKEVIAYTKALARELMRSTTRLRPTAAQTLAAIKRASYVSGSTIAVNDKICTVERYLRLKVNRTVLLVTGSKGENWVLKLCCTWQKLYKREAEREHHILSQPLARPGPALISTAFSKEIAEMALLEERIGDDGYNLNQFLSSRESMRSDSVEQATVNLALARALRTTHAEPGRAAALNIQPTNFVLVKGEPLNLVCVDYARGCSVAMQRDSPNLCPSEAEFNIFASDVRALAQLIISFRAANDKPTDNFMLRMLNKHAMIRPTMHQTEIEFAARLLAATEAAKFAQ